MLGRTLVVLWALTVLLFSSVSSAGEIVPFSVRVSVKITASAEIKGQIESYISRELRSLGDIVLTDDKPLWIISIVALEIFEEGDSNRAAGVALSVIVLNPFDNEVIVDLVSEKTRKYVLNTTSNLFSYPEHWLNVGSKENLRGVCEDIVVHFDVQVVKPFRDRWLEFINSTRK